MNKALIFDIHRCSFSDGPGIRTTVFFKGCNLSCQWCHNPESRKNHKELLFYKDKCQNCGLCRKICPEAFSSCTFCGKCEKICPAQARKICGKKYTPEELFQEIIKDKDFFDNSGGGVTFSGGECMLQIDFLMEALRLLKKNNIHTAIDTAGHIPFEYFEKIIPYTDLFLYDIKLLDNVKHKKYIGVENELILKNFRTLIERKQRVWVRIPIIKGINDSITEIREIKELLKAYTPEKTELLPYHKMGLIKSEALGIQTTEFSAPTKEEMKLLENEL